VAGLKKTIEFASGPSRLQFESPPLAVATEPLLLMADEPMRTADDDAAVSSLRAGPKQKKVHEISTTPR